jgi:hypothetical protein
MTQDYHEWMREQNAAHPNERRDVDGWMREQVEETQRQAAERERVLVDPEELEAVVRQLAEAANVAPETARRVLGIEREKPPVIDWCRHCGVKIVKAPHFNGTGYDDVWMHQALVSGEVLSFRACRRTTVAEP